MWSLTISFSGGSNLSNITIILSNVWLGLGEFRSILLSKRKKTVTERGVYELMSGTL
jgi:hypothetical protein